MSKGFSNFVALLSFTVAVTCGVMTLLSSGVGIQVYLPDITLGSVTFKPDLIQIGLWVSFLYVSTQLAQAIFHASPGFERLAFIGSWTALVLFAGTLIIMLMQIGFDAGNVRELMRTSHPFQLVITLLAIAIVDVTLLQMLKNHLIAREVAVHGDVVHGELLPAATARDVTFGGGRGIVPLIGRADNARIYYFDMGRFNGEVTVTPSQIEGGDPSVRIASSPHAA